MSAPTQGRRAAGALAEGLVVTGVALAVAVRFETPLVWLAAPIALSWFHREPIERYGTELRLTPPPLRTQLALGAVLLLVYAAGHVAVARSVHGRAFVPALPRNLVRDVLQQLFVIALPEELFFRGYLQGRWNAALGRPWRLLGARTGAALWLQAAVFALCHLATGDWTRLRVFFFGLLAGWLRERSGSIAAPSLYHAVANVWVEILDASLR